MSTPSPQRLSEFLAVATVGSVSEAARQLGLPRTTLSRRMGALEAELGVRLLHRGTRRLVLTPAGEELQRRASKIVADTDEAWDAVRRLDAVPRGRLRVSASTSFLGEMMVAFLVEFPEVELHVRATSRQVDLVGERFDVVLRFGPVRDPSLVVRRVHAGRRVVVASPEYLQRRGRPSKAEELAQHDCLLDYEGDAPRLRWPRLDRGDVPVQGRLVGNDMELLRLGARAGLGIGLLPWAVVASDVLEGRLEVVLQDAVGSDASVHLVYAERDYLDPKIRVFIDRALPVLKANLAAIPPLPPA